MDTYRAQVVGEWLLALRGSATQDVFLADLKREIGWAPHRQNLSKYENGHAIPEPETLARFMAYATKRGIAGPDFTPRKAPVYPVVEAINRQTKAIERLADHVEALLASRDKDLAALALTVVHALQCRAAPDRARAS